MHCGLQGYNIGIIFLFSYSDCPSYCPVMLVCSLPCLCGCCCQGEGSAGSPWLPPSTTTSPCPLQDVCWTWLTGDRLWFMFTSNHMLHTGAANIIWAIFKPSPTHPLLSAFYFSQLPITQYSPCSCSRYLSEARASVIRDYTYLYIKIWVKPRFSSAYRSWMHSHDEKRLF